MALLDAISLRREACDLSFVGYETTGHKGYISEFLSHADQKGLSHCVHYLGVLDRKDCLIQASRADIGISFIASKRGLFNMDNMVGASNKIFEYLAVGVMPIVKDEMMWNCAFVPNYAVACNPDDARDLARTLRWCIENRMELRRRANEGAKRIQKEWNYENSFEKVVDFLNHSINDHRRSGG
jgi:glycosyltransferase involved in cell wall biosynthesis